MGEKKKGLVYRSTGSWYEVLGEDGVMYQARLRGKLKQSGFKTTNPIAVGDYVWYEHETGSANLQIHDLLERENYIIRQSTHKTAHKHILAANIDQALILFTLTLPRTSLGFLDRFLVSAESFGIPPVILFNKLDLLSEEEKEMVASLAGLYTELGYPCLQMSLVKDEDISVLSDLLKGKKTLIAGHSGVGKSTMINRLVPSAAQRTADVSTFANKGVHTTTFAEMFRLGENTFLIDTPGIKELGIMEVEPHEMGMYFPEIRGKMEGCRYYNCTHLHEPDCAVIRAVESGEISLDRYKSYVSMMLGGDNRK
jgi:ribosome biogenesis GTPase